MSLQVIRSTDAVDHTVFSYTHHEERTYVCIDVECFQPLQWQSIGVVVVAYPSGCIIDTLEIGVSGCEVSPLCKDFWDTHTESFAYNLALGTGKTRVNQENELCAFIEHILDVRPHAFILSDNPSLDIAIVDSIFYRQRSRSMLIRNGRFYPAVDAWSARTTLQYVVGQLITVDTYCTRDITIMWRTGVTTDHTPLRDAAKVVSRYFSVLDMLNHIKYKLYANKTLYHMRTKQRRKAYSSRNACM